MCPPLSSELTYLMNAPLRKYSEEREYRYVGVVGKCRSHELLLNLKTKGIKTFISLHRNNHGVSAHARLFSTNASTLWCKTVIHGGGGGGGGAGERKSALPLLPKHNFKRQNNYLDRKVFKMSNF